MLFLVNNRLLVEDREKTYLTAGVKSTATALTVRGIDTNAWADNDWVIVGEIGTSNAEILQVNDASLADGTTLTIDNAGSGGCRYAHAPGEPVYRIDYNQVRFFHASTATGSQSTLTTIEIQPDDEYTRYEDTTQSTGFGFVKFYNSQTTALSPSSDAIPYAGQGAKSLSKMIEKVRTLADEEDESYLSDEQITMAINDKQRDILGERMWSFNEVERSQSAVANQFKYDIDTDIKTLHSIRFDTQPLVSMSQQDWESHHWDTDTSTTTPSHVAIFDRDIKIHPRPSASAASTTLNGAITASDTTITVASTSSFKRGDFYRFIINSEVIYATNSTSTTFTGCLRAQEGTTAASHSDSDTVTERDIVYTGQLYPTDLDSQSDETVIPEPLVLCYGATADLCLGRLNKPQIGDRFEAKYQAGLQNLRKRYSVKLRGQFGRIRDRMEVPSGRDKFYNPNDYPQNVTAN